MSSQNVIDLREHLALVKGQIKTLLNQSVLVNTSLDGQSFQPMSALKDLRALEKELMHELLAAQPFEIVTKNY